jgi:hypothetical protein
LQTLFQTVRASTSGRSKAASPFRFGPGETETHEKQRAHFATRNERFRDAEHHGDSIHEAVKSAPRAFNWL